MQNTAATGRKINSISVEIRAHSLRQRDIQVPVPMPVTTSVFAWQ